MKHPIWGVLGVGVIGVVFGCLLAPVITAERPLPEPIVKTVTVRVETADVLDAGNACLYTWDGHVYEWPDTRRLLGVQGAPCPSLQQAKDRWELAINSPILRELEDVRGR